jgi:hypothetical protein
MKLLSFPPLALTALALSLPAQTQLVRGKVEDIPQTNRFVLDCTSIPLVSTTLDLNAMVGNQWNLQVVNVGTATNPILDVRSATSAVKIFDMGNLRIGRAERWQVNHAPGSQTAVFVNATSLTTYGPFGAAGTWLLGGNSVFMTGGTVNNQGQFEFSFTTPNVPQLVGVSFSGQALVMTLANELVIANADCKEIRAN